MTCTQKNQHFPLSFEKGEGVIICIVSNVPLSSRFVVIMDNCTDAKHCVEFSMDVYHNWFAMSDWFYCIICTPQKQSASKFEEIFIYI